MIMGQERNYNDPEKQEEDYDPEQKGARKPGTDPHAKPGKNQDWEYDAERAKKSFDETQKDPQQGQRSATTGQQEQSKPQKGSQTSQT
jgi:hypothetical protein